jgi:hypothetical protein
VAREAIMTPSCLRVDRAIIFFMSHSEVALTPAINIVDTATVRSKGANNLNDLRNG